MNLKERKDALIAEIEHIEDPALLLHLQEEITRLLHPLSPAETAELNQRRETYRKGGGESWATLKERGLARIAQAEEQAR